MESQLKFFGQILAIIPFLFYLFLILRKRKDYELKKVPVIVSVMLLLIMAFLLGLTPIVEDSDKSRYLQRFLGELIDSEKDIGWLMYNMLMGGLLGNNFIVFFIITALIYSFSYLFFALKLMPHKNIGYFIIMVCGSLGFAGYGNNTIRMGFALSVMLLIISIPVKTRIKYLFLFIPVMIHTSMIIPILSYLFAYYINNRKISEMIWIVCLIIAIIGVSPISLFEDLGFIDQRVVNYASSQSDGDGYKAGFRIDFLIYSAVPIFIANKWINKYKYRNKFYLNLYSTYLICNSIWVLMISTNFNDRIAYLSWFMIPLLTLYPLLNQDLSVKMKNIQTNVYLYMGIFIGINFFMTVVRSSFR